MKKKKWILSAKRLLIIGTIIIGIVSMVLTFSQRTKPLCPNCNIVLIDIDVLRADGLECFGYRKINAPNLCRFAQGSVRFQRNISQSYWTMPSMFSTVTSLYVSAHKMRYALTNKLSPLVLTMAEILKSMGYQTTFMTQMPHTDPWFLNEENGGLRGYNDISYEKNIDSWLPRLQELKKTGKPFFLHVYTQDPHMPYLLPEGTKPVGEQIKPHKLPITQKEFNEALETYLAGHYKDIFQEKALIERPELFQNPGEMKIQLRQYYETLSNEYDITRLKVVYTPIEKTYLGFVDGTNPEHQVYLRMLYDMKIALMDQKLAAFISYLESSPVKDDTIIVIMSDHGEAFGERGSFIHDDSQYNETIHTPLIIRIPGLKERDVMTVTQNIDILPTLLDAIGGKKLQQFQGTSLIPITTGKVRTDRIAVSEADTNVSIQDNRWKLITHKSGDPKTFQLYDLTSDPLEKNNVAPIQQKRAVTYYRKLRALLDQADRKFENLLPSHIDSEKRRKIMKEGYF